MVLNRDSFYLGLILLVFNRVLNTYFVFQILLNTNNTKLFFFKYTVTVYVRTFFYYIGNRYIIDST